MSTVVANLGVETITPLLKIPKILALFFKIMRQFLKTFLLYCLRNTFKHQCFRIVNEKLVKEKKAKEKSKSDQNLPLYEHFYIRSGTCMQFYR
jgi:hypothetical protein